MVLGPLPGFDFKRRIKWAATVSYWKIFKVNHGLETMESTDIELTNKKFK